jgi:hypothetical protein
MRDTAEALLDAASPETSTASRFEVVASTRDDEQRRKEA